MSRDCPPHHSRPDSREVWVHHDWGTTQAPPAVAEAGCGQAGSRCSLSLLRARAAPALQAVSGPPGLSSGTREPATARPAGRAPPKWKVTTAAPVYLHLAACTELKSVGRWVPGPPRPCTRPRPCWLHPYQPVRLSAWGHPHDHPLLSAGAGQSVGGRPPPARVQSRVTELLSTAEGAGGAHPAPEKRDPADPSRYRKPQE